MIEQNTMTLAEIINESFGTAPAYYAPGVTALGWTLAISDDARSVTINPALGDEYKARVASGLQTLFNIKGLEVDVISER